MARTKKFKVGDWLIFKAATRSSYTKARRKITGIDGWGRPLVTYHGWSGFVVQPREIIEVEKS
jgi:hypothetical protein